MRPKFLFLMMSLLLWAGCSQGTTTIHPPEIRYGENVCDECGMIISDPRFASGFLHEIGKGRYESLIFDDIGNMLAYIQKHPEHNIVAWYVHDYTSEEWLDATRAYFVSSPAIQTPMGHGIVAHLSRENAQEMAVEKQGQVLDWAALQTFHDHTEHAHTE